MVPVLPVVLGGLLGAGLLLVAAPFLWPVRERARPRLRALERLREHLTLAGLPSVTPATFIAVTLVVGLVAGALTLAIVPVLALALTAALAAAAIPFVVVSWRSRARRRHYRSLWPDVVDHLVSAVRSGLSLPDGLSALASVGPAGTRSAFAAFERDYEATANFAYCLDQLKLRLADPVADRILETLRMSREVGGTELTSVLRGLSAYLRQESAIRSEVEARQSWVVNAARLGAAAPWVVLLLLAGRPEAAAAYNTPGGAVLIVGGLAVTLVAYRIMLAIGRLPEEQRWFR
ncbi:type II secretion system F family protein [Salinibacterium sp. SYSU T00001]|uniref:type II secretion system F family protein n=1 Tax=Homoserinimonas sedimenticola TaxID=2986805 RepID=UPI002235EE80|nr:type II secretion system F family protein [Salinibacterium sedimenticola]MCW4386584.1 type II secretion system F family protein [Salinibacterium sedimenticola]